jgi:hypothetical protein
VKRCPSILWDRRLRHCGSVKLVYCDPKLKSEYETQSRHRPTASIGKIIRENGRHKSANQQLPATGRLFLGTSYSAVPSCHCYYMLRIFNQHARRSLASVQRRARKQLHCKTPMYVTVRKSFFTIILRSAILQLNNWKDVHRRFAATLYQSNMKFFHSRAVE